MNEAVREMTFEEEAVLYEKSARELFAKESPGCEAPPINHLVRRGMRIIRKAREEIKRKHGRWEPRMQDDGYGEYLLYFCSECGAVSPNMTRNYCQNCGCRMDKDGE